MFDLSSVSRLLVFVAAALVAALILEAPSLAAQEDATPPQAVELRRGTELQNLIEAGVVNPKGEFETTHAYAARAAFGEERVVYRVRMPEEDLGERSFDADAGAWDVTYGTFGGRLPAAPIQAVDRGTGQPSDLKGPAFVIERWDGRRLPQPTAAVPGPAGGTEKRPVVAYAVGLAMTNDWFSKTMRGMPRVLGSRKATLSFPMPAGEAQKVNRERLELELYFEIDPTVANAWSTTWTPGDRPVEVREYLPVHVLGFALMNGRREDPLGYTEVDESVWPDPSKR
ncbi:hypothetical protein [Phycisphaera mikurensis]|uniref:Uncharacterized protein n=1 Tax=Phycisphaera mikurensis (strain NBRC 102666 / KCTC 22515 / FYK2301M01) TaxID=1142394 RepID=I0ID60_PHYMF|nr:hypothetical protein [Phycisphaera mikurensis]MBB6442322.1 hypothetical protein [Phycisphaera mikurensis]BAM03198.1 hypothetical protein PSMK_10390 [Phycisphaera mikurensis NBRC 102666]